MERRGNASGTTSVAKDEQELQQVGVVEERERVRWGIVVLLGVALVIGTNAWLRRSELLIGGSEVIGGNPPLPALVALIFIIVWNRLIPQFAVRRVEALALYAFVCLALPISKYGGFRAFFPCLTVPFYFASPENNFRDLWDSLPEWMVPHDRVVIRAYFEGSPNAQVPWEAWLTPLVLWCIFFFALYILLATIVKLFERVWIEHDRLTFPLLYLPLHLVEQKPPRDHPPFFRDGLMWLGFSIPTIYNVLNIMQSLYPSFPALRRVYDLGQHFESMPLVAIRPLRIYQLPEGVGFGYLVPQDVLFSVWFFYFVLKVMAVVGAMAGFKFQGYPYPHEQSAGGYVAMAVLLLWAVRHRLREAPRWLWAVLVVSLLIVLGFMVLAGMKLPMAVLFMSILLLFAITYSRARGEVGFPYTWQYPYGAQREMLFWLLGGTGLLRIGDVRSVHLLATFNFLSRHYYPNLISAYFLDTFKLIRIASLPWRPMVMLILLALPIGYAAGAWAHLTTCYNIGAHMLEGGGGRGDYRTYVARQDYGVILQRLHPPKPPEPIRIGFFTYGFVLTVFFWVLRRRWLQSPFHPLGIALAYAYSHHCPYWFPTFVAWALKALILWLGGMRLYRRFVPAFLGIALGHFFSAGIVWGGMLSPLLAKRFVSRYRVVFE